MSKNIQIFFVYNANKTNQECLNNSGILFFYPDWVSDEQKGALCGQIVGTVQCVRSVLEKPDVITLQNGKFLVIENKNIYYILGTDKYTSNKTLKYIANNLHSIIKLFHIDTELELFDNELIKTDSNSSPIGKLKEIFDWYLKTMSCKKITNNRNIKTLNIIFMESMQLLDNFNTIKSVLGGIIIYKNRLIATQMGSYLSELLLTLGCRFKFESIRQKIDSISIGSETQVYRIRVPRKDYIELDSIKKSMSLFDNLEDFCANLMCEESSRADPELIQTIKRGQSLFFTSVPEEHDESSAAQESIRQQTKKSRPKFLNLNAGDSSNRKTKRTLPDSATTGQIIVLNTPMQEQKKIVHFNPLLICNTSNEPQPDAIKKPESKSGSNRSSYNLKYKTLPDPVYPYFDKNNKSISSFLYKETNNNNKVNKDLESIDFFTKSDIKTITNNKSSGNKTVLIKKSNSFFFNSNNSSASNSNNTKLKLFKDNIGNNKNLPFLKLTNSGKKSVNNEDSYQDCLLFVWQQDDVLISVLLQQEVEAADNNVLLLLNEICANNVPKLEKKMRNNAHLQSTNCDKDLNKFVIIDSSDNLNRIQSINIDDVFRNLIDFNDGTRSESDAQLKLNEVLMRCDENVLYSYECGLTQVFYSEISVCNAGLPLPTDPLGILQIKAKKRLERDSSLILL